jgi:moderate conductance mechanosensitive channel
MQNDYKWLLKYSDKVLHVLLILVLAWLAYLLTKRAIRIMKGYLGNQAGGNPEELKRIETLGQVFRHTFSVIIFVLAGMLLLGEIGISIGPILATAGVVGVAIGFGAQHLIRDYFNGFFILLENQVRQGDVVVVAEKGGLVEEITLRYMKLRDYSGNVHFIPNGAISTVTNMSRGFAYAVIDIGVAYREDLDEVMNIMKQVGSEMAKDPLFSGKMLEEMEMAGVDKWDESAVIIRCRIKVQPLEQWGIRREFLKRLKQKFDHLGIEIPYPHLTVYPGQSKDGTAPPLNMVSQTTSNK